MKSTRSSDMAVSFPRCHELGPPAGHELIGSVRLLSMSSRFWTMNQFTAPFPGSRIPFPDQSPASTPCVKGAFGVLRIPLRFHP